MVYIDLLIIQDLIYNYIILLGVSVLLVRKTTIIKILLSSIIGTLPMFLIYTNLNNKTTFLVSIIFSIIMSILSFSYRDIIYTIKNIFYMFVISIFLAGSINLINTNIFPILNTNLLSVIILLILSPIITYIYIKSIDKIKINYSNYYKVDIYLTDTNKITLTAFLDTGNKLIDPYKQRPIILVKKSIINLDSNKILLVPYNTVNNNGLLNCIIPHKIYIHKIGYRQKFLIGLMDEINIDGVDCILNQQLLERI